MKTGQCECGRVAYQSEGPWRDVISCHCEECRRTSGHFWAATAVPADSLEITSGDTLKWFRASEVASRAFCTECGSSLFYRHDEKSYIAVGAGTLDGATGLKLVEEVFCHEKGDYYDLTDGVAHHDMWSAAWKAKDEAGQ